MYFWVTLDNTTLQKAMMPNAKENFPPKKTWVQSSVF